MEDIELGWLSGILEGEGSFTWGAKKDRGVYGLPVVKIGTTDLDICKHVQALLGGKIRTDPAMKAGWKDQYRLQYQGERGAEIMRILYPLMGKRRQRAIKNCLDNWGARPWLREGSKNRHAKLNADKVRTIRLRYSQGSITAQQLGTEYGVTKGAILFVIHRKSWKQVP